MNSLFRLEVLMLIITGLLISSFLQIRSLSEEITTKTPIVIKDKTYICQPVR